MADLTDGDAFDEADGDYPEGRPWWRRWIVIVAVVALAAVGIGLGLGLSAGSSTPSGPEGVPVQNVPDLASPDSTVSGGPVDGMTCRRTMDQTETYHIHVHVAIFVNGIQERIPAGAGIVPPRLQVQLPGGLFVDNGSTSCLYWLHVHANDGIIHVEAPHKQAFLLGQFFDVWNQPLGPDQVGPARGPVVAYVNGQRFSGDPRNIPLLNLEDVQLDVGSPTVAFKPLHFTVTGLCSTSCSSPGTT